MSVEPQSATYPGNLTLPVEVREKILSAFRHSLDLYRDGKLDDCLIGCDFILKMDPRFSPAKRLQEKAKNPKAEVDVEELRQVAGAAAVSSNRMTAPPPPSPPVATTGAPAEATASAPVAGTSRDTAPAGTAPVEGLEDLSLDSLSLDAPLPDFSSAASSGEVGLPFESEAAGSGPALFHGGEMASEPASAEAVSSEEEIASLLKKGDEARETAGPEQAIEIWSRVFLIDIDNADAVARIEKAREEMAAEGRRIASALEQGQESFARGDLAAARSQFDAVLALDSKAQPAVPPAAPEPPSVHDLSAVAPATDVLAEELDQSAPPGRRSWSLSRAGETAEVEAPTASRFGVIRVNRRVAIVGAAILALLAVGIFFALRPSGGRTEAVTTPADGPSLARATALFQEGKIEETRVELRRIPPSDPDYVKAQKLLASLDASAEPVAGEEGPASVDAPSSAGPAAGNPAALRAEAQRALAEKRYIDAMKTFSLAAPHFEGDPTFAQEMAAASEKVSELTPAVKLYNDGEYETAIPILWRIHQNARDNQDAKSYLLRSYYNQGIGQLQNGLFEKAKESFAEVLALDPDDADAARHRQFAERYRRGDLDLLARIYVRYVSPRP